MPTNDIAGLLKKLGCTSINTPHGVIKVDQIENKVLSILQDAKGSREKKLVALQQLKNYLWFLKQDQKKQLISSLIEVIKNDTAELKGHAAGLLESLIDHENEGALVKDNGVIPLLVSMLSIISDARKFAYRSLYKLSTFSHNHTALAKHGTIKHALTELQKEHNQICSDTCVLLLATFAKDPSHAAQITSNNGLAILLNLLRTPTATPSKLIPPAIMAVRSLSMHDPIALRTVINAGAVQLIAGITRIPRSHFHPRIQTEAALALCGFATTKDAETQDLLVRAGIGDSLVACMQHESSEVKRSAILALERWLYSDDRLTLYSIEFFLTLIQNGVEVSQRAKDLLTDLKRLPTSKQAVPVITSLLAEIKQRPDSTNADLAKLRSENQALKASLQAQQEYTKNLQAIVARFHSQADTPPSQGTIDVALMRTNEELTKLEEKITQRRNALFAEMQDRLICSVCMDKQKDSALSPCGHTLCAACAQKILLQGKCHECRLKVDKVGKLFL